MAAKGIDSRLLVPEETHELQPLDSPAFLGGGRLRQAGHLTEMVHLKAACPLAIPDDAKAPGIDKVQEAVFMETA
jgi:hypothetical protein